MQIKKILIAFAILSIALSVFAQETKPHRGRPRGTTKPSGGIVEKEYIGNVIRVINTQKSIPSTLFNVINQRIRWTSLLPVEIQSGTYKQNVYLLEFANQILNDKKIGAAVLIVEDNRLPMILASPDGRWSILNVFEIIKDSPSQKKLKDRLTKVYWSAVARSLGVGNSGYSCCVLTPYTNIEQLDRITVLDPCPEPFNKMIDSAKAFGIRTISIASYRTACTQGWAAQPTNAVQKAIWDEIHAMPTAPIKIKPETKKVRE